MTSTKYLRASDRMEFSQGVDNGFVDRKRTVKNPVLHYGVLALIVVAGAWLLVHYQSPIGCVVAVVVGLAINAIAMESERLKRMLRATEFLSALFSSALGNGYRFVAIATTAGDVVYTNREFQTMFASLCEQYNFSLSQVFEAAKIPTDERDVLTTLTKTGKVGAAPATITDVSGAVHTTTLEITPIERPAGFLLIRAK